MYPYLVADIGGTNARFALVTGKKDQQFTFEHIRILDAKGFASLSDAVRHYLASAGDLQPSAMCIALAGPVTGDLVRMTNLSWEFSCSSVSREFGVTDFLAINDFAAVAAACGQITADHLVTIKTGESNHQATRAVFGAGTGLGVAGLLHHNGRWLPNPSEGGHINIAPATPFEAEVVKAAMAQWGHVSAERFISGPGLVNIYHAICAVRSATARALQPADITKAALAGEDELCTETLSTFCSFAGSFAGNLALTYGAKGGVFMAGGVMPRFVEFLQASSFAERFADKGVMSHYVKTIPAYLITHPETAFVGAAAVLEQHLQG